MTGAYSEMRLDPGTILYKGLPVPCGSLLKSTRTWYLTDDPKHAERYGRYVCPFRVKHKLRLFEMTHENLKKLLSTGLLKNRTKERIRFAFGTGKTLGNQLAEIRKWGHNKNVRDIISTLKNLNQPGQRASWKKDDHLLGIFFAEEFLIPMGYDGYYAEARKTVWHAGHFAAEIMLFEAYQKVERMPDRMPVLSTRQLKFPAVLARLFLEYSKKTRYLIKPTKEFIVFCTGGQAVNLYLRQRTQAARIPLIRRTNDYDFSFAVDQPIRNRAELVSKGRAMFRFMKNHMDGFIKFINSNYKGAGAQLVVKRGRMVVAPPMQVPATKRRTYLVYTWKVKIGREAVDVADTALSLYPGVRRDWLSKRFSMATGIPIQQIKYQTLDALAILSGSFLYPGQVSKRNPLTGNAKKGNKNVARANQLTRVITQHAKNYPPNLQRLALKTRDLIQKIQKKNLRGAKIEAATVNALVKNLVV